MQMAHSEKGRDLILVNKPVSDKQPEAPKSPTVSKQPAEKGWIGTKRRNKKFKKDSTVDRKPEECCSRRAQETNSFKVACWERLDRHKEEKQKIQKGQHS